MRRIENIVRRSWAMMLLAIFSFSLIAPALSASPESKLPSCCTRAGKHHCSSMSAGNAQGSPSVRDVGKRCPYYPAGGAAPVQVYAVLHVDSQALFAELVSHPAAQAQTEARYRTSLHRSRQKRGPPVLPC